MNKFNTFLVNPRTQTFSKWLLSILLAVSAGAAFGNDEYTLSSTLMLLVAANHFIHHLMGRWGEALDMCKVSNDLCIELANKVFK